MPAKKKASPGRPRLKTPATKWKPVEVAKEAGCHTRTVTAALEKYGKIMGDLATKDVITFMSLPAEDRHRDMEARGWVAPPNTREKKPEDISPFSIKLPGNFAEGDGMRIEVDRLRVAVAAARGRWGQLVSKGNPSAPKAFSVWRDLLDSWTKMSKDVPKALKELDDSVSREEFESALSAALQSVDRLLLGLPQKIGQGGEMLSSEKLEAIVESEVEAVRDALYSGKSITEEATTEPESK